MIQVFYELVCGGFDALHAVLSKENIFKTKRNIIIATTYKELGGASEVVAGAHDEELGFVACLKLLPLTPKAHKPQRAERVAKDIIY